MTNTRRLFPYVRSLALAGLAIAFASLVATQASAQAVAPSTDSTNYQGDGGIIRLPTNQNATQAWHLYALHKFGLDKKHNFELQIVPAATSLMTTTAIQSGGAEVAIFSWIDIARMRKAGVNVVGVGPFLEWGADHIVVPAGSPIKNIGDFKGKRIGTWSRTSLDWVLDQMIAKNVYKLDPEKDFVTQEGSVGLIRGLIESGQLDATHMYNNLTPAMVATGKFKILTQTKALVSELGLPSTPQLLYVFTEDYAAAHPKNVQAFLSAYREAVHILDTNDDIWLEYGRSIQMTDASIVLLRDEMRADLWTTFKPTTEADIRKAFSFLLAAAGPQIVGADALPDGFMTLKYQ